MNFSISQVHIAPVYLVLVGFAVGVLGGLFGVGGSFLAGPALFGFGLPMNFVVGTDLAHIMGKSVVAARKHYLLGNIDFRLGGLMLFGTIPGVECGARLIERLKRSAHVDEVVGLTFILILVTISLFMAWESWATLKKNRSTVAGKKGRSSNGSAKEDDRSVFAFVAHHVQRFHLPPFVRLPASGIPRVSFLVIIGVSFVGGFFSGFLGGGAGYIRMPSMIYILGIPTRVAVGTDLFEVIISAGFGTITHALKGNVDVLVALVMHTGAALGAQFGAVLTQYVSGTRIRLAFFPLPLIGALIIAYGLWAKHAVTPGAF
ncbi:MAG TPA: sulfite exporter TauE/SafE family protein [Opitutaceae bacterium]|nr:sulfite exporter TauE/SafE family protein [Opitutaceae bacterium]